jgi:predicted translin family RNA/ssDNA-binding protein
MKYEIKRFCSTFVTYAVEADSDEEAYNKIKELEIDLTELQNNLEEWKEADEVISLTEIE